MFPWEKGKNHELEERCAELKALHALVSAHNIPFEAIDNSSFGLVGTDLQALQQAMSAAHAAREEGVHQFHDGVVAGGISNCCSGIAVLLSLSIGKPHMRFILLCTCSSCLPLQ